MDDEEPLLGGNATRPSRVGRHVHREAGPWTPTVHALLRHLEQNGFAGAPRVVGFDEQGREVLTYLEGDAGSTAFPVALRGERGLLAFGTLLRAFHEAVRSFDPGPEAIYRIGRRQLAPGELVCHGDPGFWNTVWRGEEIVGLIDWDFAEPDLPIMEVARAAMPVVPFRDDDAAARMGLTLPVDRRRRLSTFCSGYGGIRPQEVVEAARAAITIEIDRLRTLGGEGREPWASALADGRQPRVFESVAEWIDERASALY